MNAEDLTDGIQPVARVIGIEATARLVQEFGGGKVWVPVRPHPEHRLAQLIGIEALQKLSAEFGGQQMPIPLCPKGHGKKKALIIDLMTQGLSAEQIARHVGCTSSYVCRLARAMKED